MMRHSLVNLISKIKGKVFKYPVRKSYRRQKKSVLSYYSSMTLNTRRGRRNVSNCGKKAILPEKPLFTAVADNDSKSILTAHLF